ncbi:hypothetical protein GGR01_002519 [Acetobacter oeni]|nr:hypothetical protein [Acetobacter oeni]
MVNLYLHLIMFFVNDIKYMQKSILSEAGGRHFLFLNRYDYSRVAAVVADQVAVSVVYDPVRKQSGCGRRRAPVCRAGFCETGR